ncbi:MAG: hypothetical protein ACYC37_01975 [Desulfobacteria bacterium]
MGIDLKRLLLDRPPGGWPKEGRFVLGDDFKEVQRIREIRRRATTRHLQPSSTLPDTWKEDFRDDIFLSGRDLEKEDSVWLNAFLDHLETQTAFRELLKKGARWSEDLFLHIFIVCKPTSFRAQKLDAILEDKHTAKRNRQSAITLSKYLKRVDVASRGVGDLFGTMNEVILRKLASQGITVKSEQPDPDLVSTMLATIGGSFENHIRRSFRGPKFDHRLHCVVTSLSSLFRERFNGRPLSHIVASLTNAALPDRDAIGTREVEDILMTVRRKAKEAGLEKLLPSRTSPKKSKGSISTKKSKK